MANEIGIMPWVLLGVAFLFGWVKRVGKFAWEDLWHELFGAVARVEVERTGQAGLVKRDAVLASVFAYIDRAAPTSGVQRWMLRTAVIAVINQIVEALNANISHDWVGAMDAAKHDIESHVPWLADAEAVPPVG